MSDPEHWAATGRLIVAALKPNGRNPMTTITDAAWHVGRSWTDTRLEDVCPCPKQPCGLVVLADADAGCEQHGSGHPPRTMRQGHSVDRCPGLPRGEAP